MITTFVTGLGPGTTMRGKNKILEIHKTVYYRNGFYKEFFQTNGVIIDFGKQKYYENEIATSANLNQGVRLMIFLQK